MLLNSVIIYDIKHIISNAKDAVFRAVDNERTRMYWQIGKRIFEEEQQGKDRANYGEFLLVFISKELESEYGNGFSKRYLEIMRQFYRTFPIANTLCSQLGWSQYKLLIRFNDNDKR